MSEQEPPRTSGTADARQDDPSARARQLSPLEDAVLMQVTDVRLLQASDRTPMPRCQVLLREMQGSRTLELWFARSVGEWTASALKGVEIPWGSSPYHLTLQHLRRSGERITAVLLTTLKDGTLTAQIRITGERGTRGVTGRPADSVTLALLSDAPIYAEPDVVEASGSARLEMTEGSVAELKGSSQLAIDLFERQDEWDPAIVELTPVREFLGLQGWAMRRQIAEVIPDVDPKSRKPVPIEPIVRQAGVAWRSDALPGPLGDRLDEEVERIIAAHRLVGVAVGLAWKGDLAYFRGLGVRDASSPAPITERTVFPMMSLTKTITSIATMQLWERGLFQLDDPVDQHMKSVRIRLRDEHTVPVTIRRLLTHTHGILNEGRSFLVPRDKPKPTVTEFLSGGLVAAGREAEPWRYAQEGFVLLGQLIEELSGQSYCDYVAEHVFEPLGMKESDCEGGARLGQEQATGYERDLVGVYAFPAPLWTMIAPAMGLCYSTIRDLARYLSALAGHMPADVLRKETLAAMFEPQVVVPVRWTAHFGLGFNLRPIDSALAVGQNGGASGFMTVAWVVPEQDVGIVMCTNTSGSPGLEREPPETLLPIVLAHC